MKSCHKYRDQYIQEWYTWINRTDSQKENAGNKMRTYKHFKQVFQIEPYLLCVKLPKHRVMASITSIRLPTRTAVLQRTSARFSCSKPVASGSCSFAYWLFLAITLERKVFSKIHAVKMKKSLKEYRTYRL